MSEERIILTQQVWMAILFSVLFYCVADCFCKILFLQVLFLRQD